MSKKSTDARNVEYLQKQVKALKKQHHSHDAEAIELLQASNPELAALTPDQISKLTLHQYDYQAAVAHQFGFSNWEGMIAYAEGRPRRENGEIVISDNPDLLEALNKRARLYGMPPIGTKITNEHGIDWIIADYDFFRTPTTVGRYPDDCDYLPVVIPMNISQRLKDFLAETDRCTSKRIIFLDTMPAIHPFELGKGIHFANFGGNPEESYICLDVEHAHETIFAHELAHLWLIYVQGGDDCRSLRDRTDNRKINQLDFIQSFVLDLKVNDLITVRGFDLSPINDDMINGLAMLRDAIALGHQPPTPQEALLNSLSIASAVVEQKRWPNEMKHQLSSLLDFFEAVTPGIYQIAQEFVKIVQLHGYDNQESRRRILDECITLGFRATGDDFDLERDLQEISFNECMQNKYPEQFVDFSVPLNLEIGKTMARIGISGEGNVWLSASEIGMAQITVEDATGAKIGPLPVNYQLIPYHQTFASSHLQPLNTLIGGKIPANFGRLPGDPYYNMGFPLGHTLFNLAPTLINGMMPDGFGRLPGDAGYNTCYAPGQHPYEQVDSRGRMTALPESHSDGQLQAGNPVHPAIPTHAALQQRAILTNAFAPVRNLPLPRYLPQPHSMLPETPNNDLTQRYMAGVGLSVARARLAQQRKNSLNLYQYAYNNPLRYTDPSGLTPDPGIPLIPCPHSVGAAKHDLCRALRRVGVGAITSSHCCTGPEQAQCLIDWCNNDIGNIYCVPDSSGDCAGACAFTQSRDGSQQPDINTYLCIPTVFSAGCNSGATSFLSGLIETILHERMHACGSGQYGGYPNSDPAENRAQCLFPILGL